MIANILAPQGMIQPDDKFGYVIHDEAVTAGDLVMIDHSNTGALAGSKAVGNLNYVLYHARQPDASGGAAARLQGYFYGIALETKSAGQKGYVQFVGQVERANVDAATVQGSCLVPVAASSQLGLAVVGTPTNRKIVGIALEADTANFASILFDGINGFGADIV